MKVEFRPFHLFCQIVFKFAMFALRNLYEKYYILPWQKKIAHKEGNNALWSI